MIGCLLLSLSVWLVNGASAAIFVVVVARVCYGPGGWGGGRLAGDCLSLFTPEVLV